MSSLYILDIKPLSEVSFANIFSHTIGSLFILLMFSNTLLVGMQTGAVTVENSMEFPQKPKSELTFVTAGTIP